MRRDSGLQSSLFILHRSENFTVERSLTSIGGSDFSFKLTSIFLKSSNNYAILRLKILKSSSTKVYLLSRGSQSNFVFTQIRFDDHVTKYTLFLILRTLPSSYQEVIKKYRPQFKVTSIETLLSYHFHHSSPDSISSFQSTRKTANLSSKHQLHIFCYISYFISSIYLSLVVPFSFISIFKVGDWSK